jgi:hypothetical protein
MMQRLEPDEQAMIAPYLDSVITAMSRGAAK